MYLVIIVSLSCSMYEYLRTRFIYEYCGLYLPIRLSDSINVSEINFSISTTVFIPTEYNVGKEMMEM